MDPVEMKIMQLNRSEDLVIGDFPMSTMKGLYVFRVTEARSPHDFSIQYSIEDARPGDELWQMDMQDFYNVNSSDYKMATCRPLQDRSYVVKSDVHGWQRCVIISTNLYTRVAVVLLLDLGTFDTVPFPSFYEMDPRFREVCALGFRAYLEDVKPCNGKATWTQADCNGFEKLVKGKTFHTYVIQRIDPPAISKFPQLDGRLGVIMTEIQDPTTRNSTEMELSINTQLCAQGLAEPNGIGTTTTLTLFQNQEAYGPQPSGNA